MKVKYFTVDLRRPSSARMQDAEYLRCVSCRRPTHDTNNLADPLRTRVQASGAYVLCARCEDLAQADVGDPSIADVETSR